MALKYKKPELVAPAGDWSGLRSALAAGADSVYFGVKGLNMRSLATNFDVLELAKVMDVIHRKKRRGYLALNVIIYNSEIKKVKKILKEAKKASIDGVVLWDMAVLSLAKELGLKIHLSTQASVANILALGAYHRQGVKRVVLARENKLSDIAEIIRMRKKEKINCEIEAFIHGALCVSISGRCFLSQHTFSQSANRGQCWQPCRREYRISDIEGECEYILGEDYLLSPKDLCTLEFIDKLIEAGIDAFKIEGRIRSPEYVRVVTSVYRRAIDAYFSKKLKNPLKKELMRELSAVYNRGFSNGLYWGSPEGVTSKGPEHTHEKVYVGDVIKFYKKIGVAEIKVHNHPLKKGDQILCVGKSTPASFATAQMIQINHENVSCVERGEAAGLQLPFAVKRNDKIFIWRKKDLSF